MRVHPARLRRTAAVAGAGVIVAMLTTAAADPSVSSADEPQAAKSWNYDFVVDHVAPVDAVTQNIATLKAIELAKAKAAAEAAAKKAAEEAARKAAAAAAAKAAAAKAAQAAAAKVQSQSNTILGAASAASGGWYRWGGTSPSGFDCSGYTQYVFRKVGVSLPRTSGAQKAAVDSISRSELRPGDLVFDSSGGRVHHVAIYAGDGMVWEAQQTGTRVGKYPMNPKSGTSYGRP